MVIRVPRPPVPNQPVQGRQIFQNVPLPGQAPTGATPQRGPATPDVVVGRGPELAAAREHAINMYKRSSEAPLPKTGNAIEGLGYVANFGIAGPLQSLAAANAEKEKQLAFAEALTASGNYTPEEIQMLTTGGQAERQAIMQNKYAQANEGRRFENEKELAKIRLANNLKLAREKAKYTPGQKRHIIKLKGKDGYEYSYEILPDGSKIPVPDARSPAPGSEPPADGAPTAIPGQGTPPGAAPPPEPTGEDAMKEVHLNEAEAAKAYAKQVGKVTADKEFAEMAERYSGDDRIADVDAAMNAMLKVGDLIFPGADTGHPVYSTDKSASLGMLGALSRAMPWPTERSSIDSLLKTQQAIAAFRKLLELKKSSPTGASGLGQVTEKEIDLLISSFASLDAGEQKPEIFRSQWGVAMKRLSKVRKKIIAGMAEYDRKHGKLPEAPQTAPQPRGRALRRIDE